MNPLHVLLLLSTPGFSLPAVDEAGIRAARNGHAANLAKITTIQAEFTTVRIDGGRWPSLNRCEWWQHGRRGRCRELHSGFYPIPSDAPVPTWNLRAFDRTFGEQDRTPRLGFTNMWSQAGFIVTNAPQQWIVDVLETPAYQRVARVTILDNRAVLFVEGRPTMVRELPSFRLWLDPDRGFLPLRLVTYSHDGPFDPARAQMTSEMVAFHPIERTSGIWFPKEVRTTFLSQPDAEGRRNVVQSRFTCNHIVINEPILMEDLLSPPEAVAEVDPPSAVRAEESRSNWLWYFLGGVVLIVCVAAAFRTLWRKGVSPAV